MTIKKIINFVFPAGDKTLSQDAYYRALSTAKNGFYPFGEKGIWHGGIHVDEGVLQAVGRNENKMRCMANGEVVAYRVNRVYPKVTYHPQPNITFPMAADTERVAYFSTSFTLVRHLLEMPKIAGSSEAPPALTLYSLYMHQLDDYGYQQAAQSQAIEYPAYWQLTAGQVSVSSKDKIKGTSLRENGTKTTQLALLLKESKIKLGEQLSQGSDWYLVTSVEQGPIITVSGVVDSLGSLKGYVHKSDLVETVERDLALRQQMTYTIKGEGNYQLGKPVQSVPGIIVYAQPNDKNIVAYLPSGTAFQFDGQENGYAKISQVEGDFAPAAANGGWVKIANLSHLSYKPAELDKVVVLDKPIAISGGEFVGYLGHNVSREHQFLYSKTAALATEQRPSNQRLSPSLMGHVELFTCDDLPAFIAKSRAQAEQLPESDKSLILIERGAQLVSQKPDGSLSLTDLPPADLTNTVHFPRLLPLCSVKTDNQVTSDGQNNEWVQITAGNAQGQPISGWVNISKDSHGNFPPHIKRVSPWEWTDFNPLEETVNVANMVEKSRDNRRMALNLADYTESMTALHHILTQTPLNKAAESAAELPSFTDKQLKAGLRTPWTAEQIGRLLVKYESEWYADESLSKWHEIDSLYQNQYDQKKQSIADELTQANITKPAERDYAMQILDKSYQQQTDEWQIEKQQRIKPSLWWREVAEGQAAITPAPASTSAEAAESPETTPQPVLSNLSATGKVWHLHPVGMSAFSVSFGITVAMLKQIFTAVPKSRQDLLQFMVDDINAHMEEYKLDTPLRLSHFFAQIRQEVGTSLKVVENFSYSVSGLKDIYKYFEKHPDDAEKYGYPDKYKGTAKATVSQENQRMIANIAMGDRKDLGNLGSNTDDGWNFRGRGLKQLTGRANYTDFNNGYPSIWSDEVVDFVNNPDLLHTNHKYIVRSGIYFWLKNELYNKADRGETEDIVNEITEKINKYTKSKKDRYNNFKEIYYAKKIFNHL